ncbi:MAG TPA: DUF4412 domain-containing protein [Gemmatimonadaceae bacterium]|nr:DUF4412 domain-containing protein [Gemmatimonadaceae bacterium]
MSRRIFGLAAVSLLACVPAALGAQGTFEGVVTMKLAAGRGGGGDMVYSVKGDQLRIDMGMAGQAMYMLHDAKKQNLLVMPGQKMYFEQPQVPVTGVDPKMPTTHKAADFTMTGKKEMIAGYECEHMLITSADGAQMDACIAKGLGMFRMPTSPMGRGPAPSPAWEGIANFFPLKVQKVGGDVMLEVTKVDKKSLDNSVFTVPDDYKKMDMGMGRMGRPPLD